MSTLWSFTSCGRWLLIRRCCRGSFRPPANVELLGYPQAEQVDEGVWRTFTVHGTTASGQIQIDWTDAGSFVGQSGGPILNPASGKVVGLFRQGSEAGRFDRYIPLRQLIEHGVLERLPWPVDGDDAEGHFARRSMGHRGIGGQDVFKGRAASLDRIVSWLTSAHHDGRVLVVIGQPDAGKSAVTARAALQVARELRDAARWRGLLFHARAADAVSSGGRG